MAAVKKLTVVEALQKLDGGGALEDLKNAIEEVSAAVGSAGKGAKGKVTLELNFTRNAKNQLTIVDKVTAKTPSIVKDGSIFFVHPQGGLTREDPDQGVLESINDEVPRQ